MKEVLLAIKSEFAEKILNGEKKYEYRKRLARSDSNYLYLCCGRKIVGKVKVIGTMSGPKERIWEHTADEAGISHEQFLEYFKNVEIAHCYVLGKSERLDMPLAPISLKESVSLKKSGPQSFRYIKVDE